MTTRGHRLRIQCDGPTGRQARVWLDDLPLTYCRGLVLRLGLNDFNEVALTIGLGDIEVDAQTMAVLEAIAKRPEDGL